MRIKKLINKIFCCVFQEPQSNQSEIELNSSASQITSANNGDSKKISHDAKNLANNATKNNKKSVEDRKSTIIFEKRQDFGSSSTEITLNKKDGQNISDKISKDCDNSLNSDVSSSDDSEILGTFIPGDEAYNNGWIS